MSNGVHARPLTAAEQAHIALSAAPDNYKVEVSGDIGRCGHCSHYIGTARGRLLHTGEIVMYHRNKFRCRNCNTHLLWEPKDF